MSKSRIKFKDAITATNAAKPIPNQELSNRPGMLLPNAKRMMICTTNTKAIAIEAEITIDGVPNIVKEGESIIMPKGISHALKAVTRFKMLLTVAF